jgi:hypothetical protein
MSARHPGDAFPRRKVCYERTSASMCASLTCTIAFEHLTVERFAHAVSQHWNPTLSEQLQLKRGQRSCGILATKT